MHCCRLILPLAMGALPLAAQNCTGRELSGPYAMQLTGTTTIGGRRAPVVGIARVVLAEDGTIGGYSSVNFGGWLLGNPVTGAFTVAADCALTFRLQDDSGGFQHFRGTVSGGGSRAQFHQEDPGTGESGVLERTAASCNAADFRGPYTLVLAGAPAPLDFPGAATPLSAKGEMALDPRGRPSITWNPRAPDSLTVPATYAVQSDCTIDIEAPPPYGGELLKLRGMLIRGGAEIFAIASNAGETVSVRFTRR